MDKTDIMIRNVICNEMRRSNKNNVVTQLADIDAELNDFLKAHIAKIVNSDDLKTCEFDKDSYIRMVIDHFREENLLELNQEIGNRLYQLILENENIMEAELIVLTYQYHSKLYLGILKMNYKEKYVHRENTAGLKKAETLPIRTIQEVAIFSLSERKMFVKDKKVKINGVDTDYFSILFLECHTSLSEREKFYILNRTLKKINECYENNQLEKELELKKEYLTQLEESGKIIVQEVIQHLYDETEEKEINQVLERYSMKHEEIQIENSALLGKIKRIKVVNRNGYEMILPIEELREGTIEIQESEERKNILLKEVVFCK